MYSQHVKLLFTPSGGATMSANILTHNVVENDPMQCSLPTSIASTCNNNHGASVSGLSHIVHMYL